MAKKVKLPISIFELVVYILSGLFIIWGITYLSLGVAVSFLHYKDALVIADKHLKETTGNMGFLLQGVLVLAIGVLVMVVVLLANAKKSDRDFEKQQRRAARMSARRQEVIDAVVEEK